MEATTETTTSQTWLQHAVKNGLLLGGIHIVLFLVMYYVVPDMVTGFTYLFLIIAINFGITISTGIQWRNEIGGYMGFGTAFKHSFAVLLVNGLLNLVFVLLFMFIEPSLPQVMADSQLETSVYWAEKFGAPEDAIDKMRNEFKSEDIMKRYSFMGQLTGMGFLCIFYVIGSSITALITRRNVPLNM